MKKLLFILCVTTVLSTSAFAMNCDGGRSFKGVDQTQYCASNFGMNWYTALVWCKRHGGHLASAQEACGATEFGASCENLNGVYGSNVRVWTSTSVSSNLSLSKTTDGKLESASKAYSGQAICVSD